MEIAESRVVVAVARVLVAEEEREEGSKRSSRTHRRCKTATSSSARPGTLAR